MPFHRRALAFASAIALVAQPATAETIRWLTQTQPQNAQYPVETAAIEAVNAAGFTVSRNEFQVLGLDLADALRLAGSGSFHIVTTQVGSAARDDAFLEGIDLIGVSTDMGELAAAVEAYREVFNTRLAERFGVKALAIWPFGPQVFFCNAPLESLADLEGLRVRSFTASMSALLSELGATPVTLSFPEVYPALQRGVASCGVTSPTSANTGKWPEVTTHLLPLSVSGSVQAHMVNLAWLEGLPEDLRASLETALAGMEADLWRLATTSNDTALACSTGDEACPGGIYTRYDMALVPVSDEDRARVGEIAQALVLGEWAGRCTATFPDCVAVWNETIGAARGLSID